MNNLIIKDDTKIADMIYEIRGLQVMLDRDLAELYQCSNGTKSINLAVRRNNNKFPNDFCFQLTKEEYQHLKFQNETSNNSYGGVRKIPYAFTEQGVAMLATVLKTKVAGQVSVEIMRVFVLMKKYLSTNNYAKRISNLETKYIEHDNKFDEVFNLLDKKIENTSLFFEGQIYDSYSLMIDIFNTSKESIIIIDNYIDKSLLDILSKTNKKIVLVTNKYNIKDIEKYKLQYNNIEINLNNSFHDRFIIIDKKTLYNCGASFKDLGKKCFAINKIEESKWLEQILNKLGENNG